MKQQTQTLPTGFKTQLRQASATAKQLNTQLAKLQQYGRNNTGRTSAARNTGARSKRSGIAT